ncbi:hypothetical protein B4U80_09615 [Leptotrombidium deliense]|uniref:Uncharacterized protein n=1 Tax=Leptotrombidium deliense TaxID=299467 RepID=A0A443SBZ2_9ACAR|nr:hypothetical protein B4U80_09615 [Leptotrombidium deliense]
MERAQHDLGLLVPQQNNISGQHNSRSQIQFGDTQSSLVPQVLSHSPSQPEVADQVQSQLPQLNQQLLETPGRLIKQQLNNEECS